MKYCDLHCDALTAEGVLQVSGETLRKGDCFLQCFAAFVSGRECRFRRAVSLADKFDETCRREGLHPVRTFSDIREGEINAVFTVEEGGAVEGDLQKLEALYRLGARMMTLTWNYPNEIGYPNFPDYGGVKRGEVSPALREGERGLTPFGFEAVYRMNEMGMIADVSHGSDKLFYDVARVCRENGKPFVASHSGADSVFPCARNLTDGQIAELADCGGVVGLDFCARFTSDDASAEGQRSALLSHARAIVNAGGEDVLAIGSDFDGIPKNPYLENPARMPSFLEELTAQFGFRVAEKIALRNALRVFQTI